LTADIYEDQKFSSPIVTVLMDTNETDAPRVDSQSNEQSTSIVSMDGALDLDTQTGLKSPPARRVRHVNSPSPDVAGDDLEQDGDTDSDDRSESADSFILDLFHAEGAEAPNSGVLLPGPLIVDDIKITRDQCEALKTELRSTGGATFMRKYLEDGTYSMKEVLYAFGYILVHIFIQGY
jgi:hypothetical protein